MNLVTIAFSSVMNGGILHDRRVLFVQDVCQNLVFPGHNINNFHFHPGVSGTPPLTPSPPEILLTPSTDTPYPHPLFLTPPHPRTSLQTSSRGPMSGTSNFFLKKRKCDQILRFFLAHSHHDMHMSYNLYPYSVRIRKRQKITDR